MNTEQLRDKPLIWHFQGLDANGKALQLTYPLTVDSTTPAQAMEAAKQLLEEWKCHAVRVELRLDPFRPKDELTPAGPCLPVENPLTKSMSIEDVLSKEKEGGE